MTQDVQSLSLISLSIRKDGMIGPKTALVLQLVVLFNLVTFLN